MPDRLKELQRQRALAQEQVAWFDREIAALGGQAPVPAPVDSRASAPAQATASAPAPDSAAAARAEAAAQEIMAQYQDTAKSVQGDVKRGCFLYFFLALGLVGLGVLVLYLVTRRP